MTDLITRAQSKLGSFNPEARTVDVVLATETPVRRRSWDSGAFDEILSVTKQAINTERLDSMALLDSHDAYSGLDSRLGSIVAGSLRFEGKTAIVTAKISRNPKGEALANDLADGHVLGASVGYRIDQIEKTEAPAGGTATVRATRWTPLEISIVSVPADPAASTRSMEKETDMTTAETNIDPARKPRMKKERLAEIRSLAKSSGLAADHELLIRAVDDDMSLDQFRAELLETLIKREEETPTFPISQMRGMGDQSKRQNDARVGALVARMAGKAPEGDARDFAGLSLMDHARGLLETQGVNTRGMSREEILGYRARSGMHTTSDFPALLQGAGQRVLMDAYGQTASPLKTQLSRASTATDFRSKSKLKISDAGLLEKLSESGEIKHTTRSETAESYKIDSYGRIFSLSFQAIVNDDLGAFGDFAREAGRMSALTENKVLLDLLLANGGTGPLMAEDGKTLFHEDHGNYTATCTALSEAALAAAVLAFRKQTTFGRKIRLGATPRFLLTGPELEMQAQKLVAAIAPNKTDDAVPSTIANLIPVVEPSLDGNGFYLFADPAEAPVFEWSYLDGYSGPQIDGRDGFERLGTEFRAVLHYGAGAIDFRGAYFNAGVQPEPEPETP